MTRGRLTERFLASLDPLAEGPIPDDVTHATRLRLLDTLGCLCAGARMLQTQDGRTLQLAAFGCSDGPSKLFGFDQTSDPMTAAMINGMSCHFAELDDGHRYGIVHAGAVLLPALLSMLHHPKMTDEGFLRGILIGYEAAIVLARHCQPAAKRRGLHGTGVFGAIGACMAVATALGADRDQRAGALAAGATSASGLLSVIRGQSELKSFNAGQASQAGLSAALSGLSGFRGPADVLGGDHGFVRLMTGEGVMPAHNLVSSEVLAVKSVYLKPYASCRYAHAPVEAALSIRADAPASQISKVTVETYNLAIEGHDHSDIDGVSSAKMSVPYCVAAALVTGETGLTAFFDKRLSDPDILFLASQVTIVEDPEMSALVPLKRPAKVTITLKSGKTVSARVELPKGEPETAMTDSEISDKFLDLAMFYGLSRETAATVMGMILDPEHPVLPAFELF